MTLQLIVSSLMGGDGQHKDLRAVYHQADGQKHIIILQQT